MEIRLEATEATEPTAGAWLRVGHGVTERCVPLVNIPELEDLPQVKDATRLGERLWDIVFADGEPPGEAVRLVCNPLAARLPWETLYHSGFLATRVSLVRVSPQARSRPARPPEGNVRVRAVLSSRENPHHPAVALEGHARRFQELRRKSTHLQALEIVQDRSVAESLRQISQQFTDVLYLVAGGVPGGAAWGPEKLTVGELASACKQARVRVLIAAVCDLEKEAETLLAAGGLDALVVMRKITVEAAEDFVHGLCEAMARGDELEAAVLEARKRLENRDGPRAEWVTPIVWMACRNLRLFPAPDEIPVGEYRRRLAESSPSLGGLSRATFEQGYVLPMILSSAVGAGPRKTPVTALLRRLVPRSRVVLVGEPGAGKSTLSRYILWDWARDVGNVRPDLLPLRSSLSELLATNCDLQASFPDLADEIHARRDTGTLLLVVDGLDEVSSDRMAAVQGLDGAADCCPAILLSRPLGTRIEPWEGAGDWECHQLAPLSPGERRRLARTLLPGGDPSPLFTTLPPQSGADLLGNPWLLTLAARTARVSGHRRNRWGLYAELLTDLLDPDACRARGGNPQPPEGWDDAQPRLAAVAKLAWRLLAAEASFSTDQTGLSQEQLRFLEQIGLFVRVGDARLSFLHSTLQEWLSAWWLDAQLRQREADPARDLVHRARTDPRARGVLGFVAQAPHGQRWPGIVDDRRLAAAFAREAGLSPSQLLSAPESAPFFEALVKILEDPAQGLDQRRVSAALLGRWGEPWAVSTLRAVATDERQPLVLRRACLEALGEVGDPIVAEALCDQLRDGPRGLRSATARALGRVGGGSALDALAEALDDPGQASEVWAVCALALDQAGDGRASDQLLPKLRQGSIGQRIWVIRLLGRMSDPEAAGDIRAILEGPQEDPDLRAVCARVLARLGDFDAQKQMTVVARDPRRPDRLRRACVLALGRLAGMEAVRELGTLLADRSQPPGLRCACAQALATTDDPEALHWLHRESEPDLEVELARAQLGDANPLAFLRKELTAGRGTLSWRHRCARCLARRGSMETLLLRELLNDDAVPDSVRRVAAGGLMPHSLESLWAIARGSEHNLRLRMACLRHLSGSRAEQSALADLVWDRSQPLPLRLACVTQPAQFVAGLYVTSAVHARLIEKTGSPLMVSEHSPGPLRTSNFLRGDAQ